MEGYAINEVLWRFVGAFSGLILIFVALVLFMMLTVWVTIQHIATQYYKMIRRAIRNRRIRKNGK